jgi:hypothetical protein
LVQQSQHCRLLQQLTISNRGRCRQKNPATLESCASDFEYIRGLGQQESIIDELIEEVKNN